MLFFVLLLSCAVHAVPKMGPPGGPIFGTVFRFIFVKFFASGLKKRAMFWCQQKLCGLWRPERQLGRPGPFERSRF